MATIRQSFSPRNWPILDPPCQPTPIQPIVMRSLGATLPSLPRADELMIYGNATAPAAVPATPPRNCRRLTFCLVTMPTALLILTGDTNHY
jgi:hypothetical protein